MKKVKILFVVNDPSFFLSHRAPLALAAREKGYEVHIATAPGVSSKIIEAMGLSFHEVPLTRSGKNPMLELKALISLYRLFRLLRPDLIHLVTIKPVLYGGLIARLLGQSAVVAAISGLGSVFVVGSATRRLLRFAVLLMYRIALGQKNIKVIFQNPDDREKLVYPGIVSAESAVLIRGSGVDLSLCPVMAEPIGVPVVVMAARLLKEKGVYDFIEAARLLNVRGVEARFILVGAPDPGNPSSVTEDEIKLWSREGVVEFLGYREDIPQIFSSSHIVVLPSYYGEGLPKVLIEAAACARPVVTTDNPGCRDAIEKDASGILVPSRDPLRLAEAIERLVNDKPLRVAMGAAGRKLAEREFRLESVVDLHLTIYADLIGSCK